MGYFSHKIVGIFLFEIKILLYKFLVHYHTFGYSVKEFFFCKFTILFLGQNIILVSIWFHFSTCPIQNWTIFDMLLGFRKLYNMFIYGQCQANLVLIAYMSSEGSGEPAHPRSLARTSAARSYKQWVKRNLQTESQIPGPSEWLGMCSYNLSWQNARRHKFAWRGSYDKKYTRGVMAADFKSCDDLLSAFLSLWLVIGLASPKLVLWSSDVPARLRSDAL